MSKTFSAGDRVQVRGRTVRAGNVGVVVSKLEREAHHVTDRYLVLLDADKARDQDKAKPRQFHENSMRLAAQKA
jgi:hypothetical protein